MLQVEVFHNWATTDQMVAVFSLNNRPKEAENTPSRHHEEFYHRFRNIRLHNKVGYRKLK